MLPALAAAQSYQRIDSVTVTVHLGVDTSMLTVPFVGLNCDVTDVIVTPPYVVNPTRIYFENPLDPTRKCLIDNSAQIAALPDGMGYFTTVLLNTAAGPQPESPPSNPYDRLRSLGLPPPPIPRFVISV